MTTPTTASTTPKSSVSAWVLVGVGAAMSALAIFQWVELIHVRAGGTTFCSVNSTVNCEAVWNLPFASRVHHWLGVPVAGLGLAWGLVATGLAVLTARRMTRGEPERPLLGAARLWALAGVLACVGFGFVSFRSGVVCLTCVATYVLTLAYALTAFLALPGPRGWVGDELRPAVLWAGGFAVVAYLAVLPVGLQTPHATDEAPTPLSKVSNPTPAKPATEAERKASVAAYLAGLSEADRQGLSDALAAFRDEQVPMTAFGISSRHHVGADNAPVRMVEFTDILCPHCAHLEQSLAVLEQKLPPGLLSVESRYFPLDGNCNRLVQQHAPNETRCAGAYAQICLEPQPDFEALRRKMFEAQRSLTPEMVVEIGSSGSLAKDALVACMQSPATRAKLEDDLKMAEIYHLEGTPLVLINGKQVVTNPTLLYVLAMTGAQVDAPELAALPTPNQHPQ